ncbi:YdjY domain-containing protein [Planctomicrobium piriforme]|uniref:Uncharacterized protein n=1 Tax=Planctomicrobium piriforme TaxID=1576369 RepID=A0A1I3G547_9PLAN|nr:YdjY domain-containing protein [Planctomicrobium piriforme]SFI18281.1 hypothetical protein SAMN05421753_106174 [Planctomicrobium piriforme]
MNCKQGLALLWAVTLTTALCADEPAKVPAPEASTPIALNPQSTVLLEKGSGKLLLKTKVCLREGLLEMFLCPKMTKEHESILNIDAKAQVVHAGLLALGAKAGQPARFTPEFQPPEGQRVEIYVSWEDASHIPQRMRAQDWIRHSTYRYFEAPLTALPKGVKFKGGDGELQYDDVKKLLLFFGTMTPEQKARFLALSGDMPFQKAVESLFEQSQPRGLEAEFVFTGSGFSRQPNGEEVYQAEGGSLICVANFGDATLDINMKSTASNDSGLLFEPWTERIPPLQTDVTVELIPVMTKPAGGATSSGTMK